MHAINTPMRTLFKTLVTTLPVVCFTPVAMAQPVTLEWSQTYSGEGEAVGFGLAVDPGKSVYVTGRTWEGGGTDDLFLLKYDLAGNPVWDPADRTWGGSDYDGGLSVAVSGSEVYVAGFTHSYGGGCSNAVTLKYSTDGVLNTTNSPDGSWTLFSGDTGYNCYDAARDLSVDDLENLYVAGDSERAFGNFYTYIEQYDSSGAIQLHEHYGTPGTYAIYYGYGLAIVGANLYTAGSSRTPESALYDVVVLKYDTAGTFVWAYPWADGTTHEMGYDIAVEGSDIYVTGYVGSGADPNGTDLLILKLHDDGTSASKVDSAVFVGADNDHGSGIALADGKIYIAGSTTTASGDTDALLLAYDTDLNLLWEHSWGGSDDDAAYDVVVRGGTIYVTGTESGEAFVNAYTKTEPIPTVSEWGVVMMTLLLLSAATVVLRGRRTATG